MNLRMTILFTVVSFALLFPVVFAEKKTIKPTKEWRGSVDNEELMKNAPEYITDNAALEKIWREWKIPEQKPQVNFGKEIVVLATSRGSALNLVAILDELGNLSVSGLGTMDFRPGFRYVIGTVSRKGIRSINGKDLSSAQSTGQIHGVKWKLKEIKGVPVTAAEPYLEFNRERKSVSGSTGCNRMIGNYDIKKSSLKFSPMVSTKMACLNGDAMRIESEFLKVLGETTRHEIRDGMLRLYAGNELILAFSGN